jgi:hypothetical protein
MVILGHHPDDMAAATAAGKPSYDVLEAVLGHRGSA